MGLLGHEVQAGMDAGGSWERSLSLGTSSPDLDRGQLRGTRRMQGRLGQRTGLLLLLRWPTRRSRAGATELLVRRRYNGDGGRRGQAKVRAEGEEGDGAWQGMAPSMKWSGVVHASGTWR